MLPYIITAVVSIIITALIVVSFRRKKMSTRSSKLSRSVKPDL